VSLLIGDDSPEGAEPQDWEQQAPAGQGRPASAGKRRDWSRWRSHRPRSMLIQDAPDPAEDGPADDYGAGDPRDHYRYDLYYQPGYPDGGITVDRYPERGYAGDQDYPVDGPGEPDSGYSGYPGQPGGEDWYGSDGDDFRGPPVPPEDEWGNGYEPEAWDEPPRGRAPLLEAVFPRREVRAGEADGSRTFVSNAQRLGGVLLAAASVVGIALYVPSILAADSRSFAGVVSSSGVASLNFGASGRVGTVLVRPGQAVRKGELLATEAGAAGTAAVRADRAAITADKANLAALQADGSAGASITAAQAELARDRARRAADRMRLAATEIVAPSSGTVIAIDGQPGETVSPAGLSGSAAHAQASPGRQPRFSLLPSGPMASLSATGLALPVIALRTGGGWQVRLLIPQTDTAAVKAGGEVTISVPAAQLSGVKGTITEVSPTPVTSSGSAAYEAVVRVLGRTPVTPLSGMTANVQLGSLRLHT
jgi:multidrug efflux pump subunit AcrA (membrane-fusion protein)